MTTLHDLVREQEQRVLTLKRAAELARRESQASPDDHHLRYAAEDADTAHRDAGRKLAELRREQAEDAEIDRLQTIVASELRDLPDGTHRWHETFEGFRERERSGKPLPDGVVAFDADLHL